MFILQTTAAVLISFLAVIAYNEIQNRLAKGRLRRQDLETHATSKYAPAESPGNENLPEFDEAPTNDEATEAELNQYRQIYYKLHNLESNPSVLPECRQLLLSLLSSTLTEAQMTPTNGILSLSTFSHPDLAHFLHTKDTSVTTQWEAYVHRRRAGSPREIFTTKREAIWWLTQAAPVKLVDGAWLGHINQSTTPFALRRITKNAWQTMSEELGDGDLAKNHVYIYRKLLSSIGAPLPSPDSADFIHPRHGLDELRVWRAAVAQLLISLFPHEFLPEALGFNMAYESLPLHLLKTIRELREVGIDPFYFELHVSIDNADSGHAAMAAATVAGYLSLVEREEGAEAARRAWRRVQAGYVLAEGLPTTPESPSLKVKSPSLEQFDQKTDQDVLSVFAAKSAVAHKIHCNSRLKIGKRSLVDWLEPNAFQSPEWQRAFLRDLSNCRPWVVRGSSGTSRLVQYLSWEGKMFGSFTQAEVEVVKAWIDSLAVPRQGQAPDLRAYYDFTGTSPRAIEENPDTLVHYPVVHPARILHSTEPQPHDHGHWNTRPLTSLHLPSFLALWFASPALLESLPTVPIRASDEYGSALIRVIRAQNGFDYEGQGVAGMDEVRRTDDGHSTGIIELGLEMCRKADLAVPTTLKEAVTLGDEKSQSAAASMVSMGMHWLAMRDVLVGMTWEWMEVHEWVAAMGGHDALLREPAREVLRQICVRERSALEVCYREVDRESERRASFRKGIVLARAMIEDCFTVGRS